MFGTSINVLTNEVWTFEWTNATQISHLPINLCVLRMCFQCMILIHETYELWMDEFCMIFITKSWNAKFMMYWLQR
jgi:hypothetical protein